MRGGNDSSMYILKVGNVFQALQEKRGFLVQCLSMHVLIGQTLHKNEEIDMFLV